MFVVVLKIHTWATCRGRVKTLKRKILDQHPTSSLVLRSGPAPSHLMLWPHTTTSAFTFNEFLLEVLTKNIIVKLGYFVKIT